MMGFSFLAAFSADGLLGRLGGGGLSGTDFVLLVESSVEPGFFTAGEFAESLGSRALWLYSLVL